MLHDKKQIPLRQDTLLRSIYLKRGPQQQQRQQQQQQQQRQAGVVARQSSSAGIVEPRSSASPEETRKDTKKKNKDSCILMWRFTSFIWNKKKEFPQETLMTS